MTHPFPISSLSRTKGINGLILALWLAVNPFTANAAIDDPLTDYCDLRYFTCNKTGTNAGYRLPGDVRVSADFYCGLMKEATYERPREYNSTKFLPLPDNLDQQILNENLGGSEWVVENTRSDPQDNSTDTHWIRKDDYLHATTRKIGGQLVYVRVWKEYSESEELQLPARKNPETVTLEDIEAMAEFLKINQAVKATRVLSVEVKKHAIIEAELSYIRYSKKRWNMAAAEATKILEMEGLQSYVKEWLNWVIKGSNACDPEQLAEFHIAAEQLQEHFADVRKMAQP
ncbi:MAG: hypothetical protein B9S32_04190 [Verrucomicrobia bacterium Tous-C9LFEB]|nr:MAG: hypothetical protein B9S32_04190 [Verrucomicrobia bacterium Tous-C9LFEB]